MGSGEKKTDTFIVVSRRSGRYMFDQFRPIKMQASRGFDDERVLERLKKER